MNSEQIANKIISWGAKLPATLTASMIAFTFGCDKRTATKALETVVTSGLLKKNGLVFSK